MTTANCLGCGTTITVTTRNPTAAIARLDAEKPPGKHTAAPITASATTSRTASPTTLTTLSTSSTPVTACLTPFQRLTASHDARTVARNSPSSPSSSPPTPPTSNPREVIT